MEATNIRADQVLLTMLKPLWYNGLGKLYLANRRWVSVATQDDPKVRLFVYCVLALFHAFTGFFGLGVTVYAVVVYPIPVFTSHLLFLIVVTVFTLIMTWQGYKFYSAFRSLKTALQQNQDTDYADPFRVKLFYKAFKWAHQKGLVSPEGPLGAISLNQIGG